MNSSEWLLLQDTKKQMDQLVNILDECIRVYKKYEPMLDEMMRERGLG